MHFDIPIIARNRQVTGGGRTLSVQTRMDRSEDGAHNEHAAADMRIAEAIGETLFSHYPGHVWQVHVDSKQGVAFIKLAVLMRGGWKYILKLRDLNSDPGLRCVIRAGGEILERFNIPRSGFDLSSFMSARPRAIERPRDVVPIG
jgi:hypothetical protein